MCFSSYTHTHTHTNIDTNAYKYIHTGLMDRQSGLTFPCQLSFSFQDKLRGASLQLLPLPPGLPPPPPPPPAQACPLFLGALRYQKITPIVSLVNFWSNKGLLRAFYFNWSAGEGRGWQLLGFSFISIVYTFQPRRHPLHHWHNTWPNTLLSHLLTEVRPLPDVCLFGYLWVTKCRQNSKWAGVWKLVPGFVARNRFLEWNVYRWKVFCRKNSESVSVFAAEQNFTNLFNSGIHLADCIQY